MAADSLQITAKAAARGAVAGVAARVVSTCCSLREQAGRAERRCPMLRGADLGRDEDDSPAGLGLMLRATPIPPECRAVLLADGPYRAP